LLWTALRSHHYPDCSTLKRSSASCERYALDMDPSSVPGLIERFGVRFPAQPLTN